jgi:hypothetical protein
MVAFHSLVGTWRLSTNSWPIFCALSFRVWPRTRESEQLCLISHIATPLLGHLYAAVPLNYLAKFAVFSHLVFRSAESTKYIRIIRLSS